MTTDQRPTTNDSIAVVGKAEADPASSFDLRPSLVEAQLLDTQRAFNSVAPDYDGPKGNNALIQRMRETTWRTLTGVCPPGARLLDLGCGTGIDAVELARRGYRVVATDWSPQMVERTHERAHSAGLGEQVSAEHIGIHELDRLQGQQFDAIYSNFGPLNCVPDLAAVARSCAALLRPGGTLVFSVIGRICPWEFCYYMLRGRPERAKVRGARGPVPVGMNRHTIWAFYYTPRQFYRAFSPDFALSHYQALSLFLPPPYLISLYQHARPLCDALGWLDDRLGGLPLLRDMGDHFLIVMTKRSALGQQV
ncbi:MAG TPA: class I SAM-dependent methyltransferase [Roseiflexaceae bacterium]|nr:class I SAM-dependent methyltransferase [Roseiflexaceae bacterium]